MSNVYFSETHDRKHFVDKIVAIFKSKLDEAQSFLIKPNVVSYEPYPTTTHPDVLEALLGHISDRPVMVGDGPAVDAGRSNKILNKSPLREICDKYGAKMVNFYSKKMKTMKSARGYKIKISTLPFENDFVISLPVLKAHNICGLSGALKNQFGYLSRIDRILMHTGLKNLDKGIAEINAAIPTRLIIVDAVETLTKAQECRHGGCHAKLNRMIAGTDPVSIDSFGLSLLQKIVPEGDKEIKNIDHIDYAQEYGVGKKEFYLNKI